MWTNCNWPQVFLPIQWDLKTTIAYCKVYTNNATNWLWWSPDFCILCHHHMKLFTYPVECRNFLYEPVKKCTVHCSQTMKTSGYITIGADVHVPLRLNFHYFGNCLNSVLAASSVLVCKHANDHCECENKYNYYFLYLFYHECSTSKMLAKYKSGL